MEDLLRAFSDGMQQRQTRVSSRLDSREKLESQSQYQSRKLIFLSLSLNLSLRY